METLFIADDESSIREGLKCILDWESLGFTICGEAATGEEALSGLVTLNPSLALLDVRMPKMLGTEVLKRARATGFTGKCIILSGYSDFTYAKEAIINGVSFYITKPLDEDELLDAVMNVKSELSKEKQHSNHLVTLKNKAKEVIVKEMIHGTSSDELSPADLELLQLDQDIFQVLICESFNKDSSSPYTLADLLTTGNHYKDCFEQFTEDGLEIVLLKGNRGISRLDNILDHFDEELQDGSPLASLFITYGRTVNNLNEVSKSYDEAYALLGRHFFCPIEQHYMGYDELPSSTLSPDAKPEAAKLEEYADQIKGYIQSFNHQQLADAMHSVKDYLVETTNDIQTIKMFLTDLYWQVKENIIRVYPNMDIPFPSPSSAISYIEKANYLYEIIRYISEQCSIIMDATGSPSRDSILDDILYYIDHNYTGNIKLETIAPLFGYNSAYLGKIFHKTVGESFNSYIDHKRIDASKTLLENENLKVYEISDAIGYKNVDYFHKKFRKYVGISPAEYRKNYTDSEN